LALGATLHLRASGAQRFDVLQHQAGRLFSGIETVAHPACAPRPPRLWGGFSFAPGSAEEPEWRGFGDAHFLLPSECWHAARGIGALTLTFDLDDRRERENLEQRLGALESRLVGRGIAPMPSLGPPLRPALEIDPASSLTHYAETVAATLRHMPAHQLEKVVLARRLEVLLNGRLDLGSLLGRLALQGDEATVFAIRMRDALLVGATPERLVERRGTLVRTEALAGTITPASEVGDSQRDKLRREHQCVVDHVAERLRSHCSALHWSRSPEPLETASMVHLRTRFAGSLRQDTHVLALAQALHPTPAVAGLPQIAAMRELQQRERTPRGWYAGAVGWFDATGDGELAVALRCSLMHGRRAWLYAGAGIVAGSSPVAEAAETTAKMCPMLELLGMRYPHIRGAR
jgi:menaquinone-specific isochorismate synthase